MQNRIFSLFILTFFFLSCATITLAQNPVSDWSNVQKIALGTDLIIEPKTGKTIKASLENRNDTGIVVFIKKKLVTINKDSIKRIYNARTKSRKNAERIGTAIGIVAGLAFGIRYDIRHADEDSMVAFPLAIWGGGGGYLFGKLFGSAKKKGQLIYETQ